MLNHLDAPADKLYDAETLHRTEGNHDADSANNLPALQLRKLDTEGSDVPAVRREEVTYTDAHTTQGGTMETRSTTTIEDAAECLAAAIRYHARQCEQYREHGIDEADAVNGDGHHEDVRVLASALSYLVEAEEVDRVVESAWRRAAVEVSGS